MIIWSTQRIYVEYDFNSLGLNGKVYGELEDKLLNVNSNPKPLTVYDNYYFNYGIMMLNEN